MLEENFQKHNNWNMKKKRKRKKKNSVRVQLGIIQLNCIPHIKFQCRCYTGGCNILTASSHSNGNFLNCFFKIYQGPRTIFNSPLAPASEQMYRNIFSKMLQTILKTALWPWIMLFHDSLIRCNKMPCNIMPVCCYCSKWEFSSALTHF